MSTSPYPGPAAAVPTSAPVKAVKAQRQSHAQYIYQSHCAIDAPMKAAIERMARRLRITESSVHRMALVYYLVGNDPVFAREGHNG
jgi:hypothetical protein